MSVIKLDEDLKHSPLLYVEAIKAFNDNYIWALRTKRKNSLALVDPGDADVCIKYIEENNLTLHYILITHHHNDHVGGISTLLDYAKNHQWSITVYGPANEKIQQLNKKLTENDCVHLPEFQSNFNVIDLPGHTKGHIAYLNNEANSTLFSNPILFCGDTLFSGGCGRLFEGTPEQMHNSLNKLSNLPDNTLIYCAHEYTQANLSFALAVEPMNKDLLEYNLQVKALRLQNKATIPSSIGLEKCINPFLRCHHKSINIAADDYRKKQESNSNNHKNTVEVFTTIRHWKDQY